MALVRALRLHGKGDLRLHEEASPTPAEGEVLLRVTAVGLCGSDRHWYTDGGIGDALLTRPLVLGHEFVGTVESGPRAGERVAVEPAIPCEQCVACRAGKSNLCVEPLFAGYGSTDGALRSAMAWPERLCYPIPDRLSDAEGALLEPLGVALHALDLGHVRPGMRAGVFGCGPIGLLLVQLLCAEGIATLATDVLPHRVEAAAAAGASGVLVQPDGELDPALGDVDVAFEVAGANGALDDAVRATQPGGRIVIVGIPSGNRTSFTASPARRKGLTILLSRRMAASDLPRAVRLAESGQVRLGPLVTERHGLDAWDEAFAALRDRRGLKVVVEPGRTGDAAARGAGRGVACPRSGPVEGAWGNREVSPASRGPGPVRPAGGAAGEGV